MSADQKIKAQQNYVEALQAVEEKFAEAMSAADQEHLDTVNKAAAKLRRTELELGEKRRACLDFYNTKLAQIFPNAFGSFDAFWEAKKRLMDGLQEMLKEIEEAWNNARKECAEICNDAVEDLNDAQLEADLESNKDLRKARENFKKQKNSKPASSPSVEKLKDEADKVEAPVPSER